MSRSRHSFQDFRQLAPFSGRHFHEPWMRKPGNQSCEGMSRNCARPKARASGRSSFLPRDACLG